MIVAIIKNKACIDYIKTQDLLIVHQELVKGRWPGADFITELPEGFNVGDIFDGETWIKDGSVKEPTEQELEILQLQTEMNDLGAAFDALLEVL